MQCKHFLQELSKFTLTEAIAFYVTFNWSKCDQNYLLLLITFVKLYCIILFEYCEKNDEDFRQWLLKLDELIMWHGNVYRNKGIPYCWNVKHKKKCILCKFSVHFYRHIHVVRIVLFGLLHASLFFFFLKSLMEYSFFFLDIS